MERRNTRGCLFPRPILSGLMGQRVLSAELCRESFARFFGSNSLSFINSISRREIFERVAEKKLGK